MSAGPQGFIRYCRDCAYFMQDPINDSAGACAQIRGFDDIGRMMYRERMGCYTVCALYAERVKDGEHGSDAR